MNSKKYYIYIISNIQRTTLYIGVTNNLERRIYEHKNGLIKSFSKKYNLKFLVHYEETNSIEEALKREKRLKKWNREWKNKLIEKFNPNWDDLSANWF